MDGLLDNFALRDIHERSVPNEGGIERNEGVVLAAGVAGQVWLIPFGIVVKGRCETPRSHPIRKPPKHRKVLRVMTVHEHEPDTRQRLDAGARECLKCQPVQLISSRLEGDL